jgi:hypothetical protein
MLRAGIAFGASISSMAFACVSIQAVSRDMAPLQIAGTVRPERRFAPAGSATARISSPSSLTQEVYDNSEIQAGSKKSRNSC